MGEALTATSLEVATKALREDLSLKKTRQKDEFKTLALELEYICKDGSRICAETKTTLLYNMDGQPVMLVGVARDITERKRAEEALRYSEEQLRLITDALPVLISYIDSKQYYRFNNKAYDEWFGHPNTKLIGKHIKEVLGEPVYQVIRKYVEAVLSGQEVTYEGPMIYRDGEARYVIANYIPHFGERGEVKGYFLLVTDITERKRAEEELRKFKSIADRAGYGVGIITPDGTLAYVNESFAAMHGYTVEELTGKHFSILHTEEQMKLVERLRNRLVKPGSFVAEEVGHKRKDGTVFPALMNGTAIRDNEGKPLYLGATAIDITERKRLEENMEFYVSEITKAQEEERKRIARELHDESAQSLATLCLEIDAVAKAKERIPEDVTQHLQRIRADANKILEGLRRFSHKLRPGEIDHIGLVAALESLTEEMNKAGGISNSLEITGSERRLIPETELLLFRIAQEALHNVWRHSGATKAAVRVKFTDRKVKLTVSDNGTGFKLPEKLGDFAAKSKLGLLGMQERARLLDSKFLVKSIVGRGTTVAVKVGDSKGA